jgi:hypothetical protein
MPVVFKSKVIPLSIMTVALFAFGYGAVSLWAIRQQRAAAAQQSKDVAAVREYVSKINPQLAGDLRFEEVSLLGYRCEDGARAYIGLGGTVSSQDDWDALNTLITDSHPPIVANVQTVLIRRPATNFEDYEATVTPDGRLSFGRGPARRPTVEMAMSYLTSVDLFAPGGWGFCCARVSRPTVAVLFVAMQTNAVELFSNIVTNGHAEAKLYALCGIRKVAPDAFDAFARSAATSAGWTALSFIPEISAVQTASGCSRWPDSPSRVIETIRRGEYDHYFGIKRTN